MDTLSCVYILTKDCTKFASITKALQTSPAVCLKKEKAKESEVAIQLFSPDGTSGSYDAGNATLPCPIGNKASKRKVEEEKNIDNVTSKLKEGCSSGGTGTLVAKAITDFSFVLSSFFNQLQDTIMCQSVDPSLCKTYQELLMKEKIYELEKQAAAMHGETDHCSRWTMPTHRAAHGRPMSH